MNDRNIFKFSLTRIVKDKEKQSKSDLIQKAYQEKLERDREEEKYDLRMKCEKERLLIMKEYQEKLARQAKADMEEEDAR